MHKKVDEVIKLSEFGKASNYLYLIFFIGQYVVNILIKE